MTVFLAPGVVCISRWICHFVLTKHARNSKYIIRSKVKQQQKKKNLLIIKIALSNNIWCMSHKCLHILLFYLFFPHIGFFSDGSARQKVGAGVGSWCQSDCLSFPVPSLACFSIRGTRTGPGLGLWHGYSSQTPNLSSSKSLQMIFTTTKWIFSDPQHLLYWIELLYKACWLWFQH